MRKVTHKKAKGLATKLKAHRQQIAELDQHAAKTSQWRVERDLKKARSA